MPHELFVYVHDGAELERWPATWPQCLMQQVRMQPQRMFAIQHEESYVK